MRGRGRVSEVETVKVEVVHMARKTPFPVRTH
jgi:hypothetical protein